MSGDTWPGAEEKIAAKEGVGGIFLRPVRSSMM